MKLYIYIDRSSFEEENDYQAIAQEVESALQEWVVTQVKTELVSSNDTLGINLELNKKQFLKEPLNFLYSLAKTHKCDFVVGVFDEDIDNAEDVCFFGYEEGKPDLYEVASYVGL